MTSLLELTTCTVAQIAEFLDQGVTQVLGFVTQQRLGVGISVFTPLAEHRELGGGRFAKIAHVDAETLAESQMFVLRADNVGRVVEIGLGHHARTARNW